jgi:hypothetical protein
MLRSEHISAGLRVAEPQHSAGRSVTLSSGRTPHAAQLEKGKEIAVVNPIIPFSILALFWLVLTVGAAIAAVIARLFTGR